MDSRCTTITHRRSTVTAIILLLVISMLASCQTQGVTTDPVQATPQPGSPLPSTHAGEKIVWVDSYHEGYEWSDGIGDGIKSVLNDTRIELKTIHLDTKRNPGDEFCFEAGKKAKAEIDAFAPDLIIASDDNAQKCVVVPYYKNTATPVVFAAVNWDASIYGYPTSNITGMVEIELVPPMIKHLKQYATGNRVGYVTVGSETENKVISIYNQRYFNGSLKTYIAHTFDELKAAFIQAQTETDMIIVGTNAGIDRWDDAEAQQFFKDHTLVPTTSAYDWMAPYVLVTLGKVSEEQGEWAAQAALRILDGTPVSDISIAQNKKTRLFLNLNIAEKLDVIFPPSVLKNAEIFGAASETSGA